MCSHEGGTDVAEALCVRACSMSSDWGHKVMGGEHLLVWLCSLELHSGMLAWLLLIRGSSCGGQCHTGAASAHLARESQVEQWCKQPSYIIRRPEDW